MSQNGNVGGNFPESYYSTMKAIERKCEPFGIECDVDEDTLREDPIICPMHVDDDFGSTYIEVGPHADFALATSFERYRDFRQTGHWAIWSQTCGAVECEVEPYEQEVWRNSVWDRGEEAESTAWEVLHSLGLVSYDAAGQRSRLEPGICARFDVGEARVCLGACSDEWAVWHNLVRNPHVFESDERAVVRRALTLRVEGVEVTNEKIAGQFLDTLGDSALFEIDKATGIGLKLARVGGGSPFIEQDTHSAQLLPSRLSFTYDPQPLSLYRYGKSAWASGMPLMAFLAFYQVLEYHFPAYSPSTQIIALRNKLQELAGEVTEADVDAILKSIGTSKRRLFPEESKQLMSTLERCVQPEALDKFLCEDKERVLFWASPEARKLSKHTIELDARENKRRDHRNKVAHRIYDLRNRIVHTKNQAGPSEGPEPLLPFDQEAESLWNDAALARFLAQRVLSASAKTLGALPHSE